MQRHQSCASTYVSEITCRRIPVQQFLRQNMELPNLQWIISVVLSYTTNIPPFRYIRPYPCPPYPVHDKARRSRMIHCNYNVLSSKVEKRFQICPQELEFSNQKSCPQTEYHHSKTSIKSANTQNSHENSTKKLKS